MDELIFFVEENYQMFVDFLMERGYSEEDAENEADRQIQEAKDYVGID